MDTIAEFQVAQPVTADQIADFRANGYLVLPSLLPAAVRAALAGWVETVAAPIGDGERRLHYFEQTDAGRSLTRTERFADDHPELACLLTRGLLPLAASALLGERALLYKEKVNYKPPGGAGFAPHQDATAYAFVRKHVTCLVAVDAMTLDNGCIEFAPYGADALLPGDGDGCIDRGFAATLAWETAPVPAGAVVFFTSYVPHRSGPNRTAQPRRALYLTYNAHSEGDRRASYYDERDRSIEAARAAGVEHARISTIGHFEGRPA